MGLRGRTARGAGRGRGFTLVESVVALALIGAVGAACLELRAQGLAATRSIRSAAAGERGLDALLAEARAGLLGDAVESRDERGRVVARRWSGERAGERFECAWERVTMANPVAGAEALGLAPAVEVARWTVSMGERRAEVYDAGAAR